MSPAMFTQHAELKPAATAEQAAEEFEALLATQMLKVAREAGSVLSEEPDGMTGAANYLEFAEAEIGRALARRGELGFARMMLADLQRLASPEK